MDAELAVKGANGTLTTTDRCYITMEVRQLMSEIDRIQSTTTFNDQNLLDGTFKRGFQVGADPGQHITVSIDNMNANDLTIFHSFSYNYVMINKTYLGILYSGISFIHVIESESLICK